MKGVFTGQGELAIPRKGSFFLARLVPMCQNRIKYWKIKND